MASSLVSPISYLCRGGQWVIAKSHAYGCVRVCAPASVAWSLHRDLGFPLDLVDLMLEDTGVQVDKQELDRLMEEHRQVRTSHHAPQLCMLASL